MSRACMVATFGTTRYWRTSPPIGMTCATPGRARSCGRSTKSASSRTSIGETLPSLVSAISMISPMIEVTGPIWGLTPRGSCSRMSVRRSATSWRAVDIDTPVEFDIDDGQPDTRYRAHANDPRHSVHGAFDRECDELLHLLRREPLRLGQDIDGRPVEIREHVDRDARQRERSVGDEHDRHRQDEQAIAQTVADDKPEHRGS